MTLVAEARIARALGLTERDLALHRRGGQRVECGGVVDMAGPLGSTLARRVADPTTGIILNSWVDADRTARGGAAVTINQ